MNRFRNFIALGIAATLLSQMVLIPVFAQSHTESIDFIPSPNYSSRPEGVQIGAIVLHASERPTLEDVVAVFNSEHYEVSAHYSIGKDGRIVQHVREKEKAWHAGESKMPDGRPNVNDFSIGIELVNRNNGFDPYPLQQLSALRILLTRLKKKYPEAVVLFHSEVAWPRGRKNDPRGFKREWLQKE